MQPGTRAPPLSNKCGDGFKMTFFKAVFPKTVFPKTVFPISRHIEQSRRLRVLRTQTYEQSVRTQGRRRSFDDHRKRTAETCAVCS
jgi:hypothetical protein